VYNCIFSPHCTEMTCDRSCPIFVQTNYLLERNGISFSSAVFKRDEESIKTALNVIHSCQDRLGTVVTENTVNTAELLTYCSICENWKGSQLHCNVYSLKFSRYIEITKQSWNTHSETDELEYMRIWSNSSKVLIVSNIDYVNFGDFESQTLLNLIQSRQVVGKTTIIVSPPLSRLVGKGSFFVGLHDILERTKVK